MNDARPAFLITIDTEGDNLWSRPSVITTANAQVLPRFQQLCERHQLRPTWLVNYEMAASPEFCEFGEEVLARDRAELGMHLHAWNSPPCSGHDPTVHSYLTEFPPHVMREKIRVLTDLLQQRFEREFTSHRAGRWGLNCVYAKLLVQAGYRVDCSVTPYVSWAHCLGDPDGIGGPDFSGFPARPYYMDLDRIDRRGDSSLLEVPMTIVPSPSAFRTALRLAPAALRRRILLRHPWQVSWLRPNGSNLSVMLAILKQALLRRWPYVEFMLHSSELMAGGSPTFPAPDDIERLYDQLDELFESASRTMRGMTLNEFHQEWAAASA